MADTDLIACLYAASGRGYEMAKEVIKSDENSSRYVPPQLPSPSLGPSGAPARYYSPCLQLTFSPRPKRDLGLVCGSDPDYDIVLPNKHGISFHHGAFTFDEHNRFIYRDINSPSGSQVIYDNEGHGRRSKFHWILGGHRVPNKKTAIIIHLTKSLSFHVVVYHYDITSPLYVDKVNWFRQGTATVEGLFDEVNLKRPPTEPASGVHSPPGTGPITLRKKLGEGSFGVVWHVWDVSTGEEHALKEPSAKARQPAPPPPAHQQWTHLR